MQHLQDIFGTAHLVEPVMYQRGSAGEKVISHNRLDVSTLTEGVEGMEIGI